MNSGDVAEKPVNAEPDTRQQHWTLSDRWRAAVRPAPTGLPNWRVVVAFPAVLIVLLIVLVGLGITGSSTGYLHQFFATGSDSNLLSGEPEAIRSDEWSVQTAWTISQVEQGLPVVNRTFPGGIDTTVQSDLPSWDWSMAFRPHLVGFWFLPLDNAMALKWWLPGFALMAFAYLATVTFLPRRPFTAAAIAVGFFFAPFFQWWYLPVTLWPAAWAFAALAAFVWLLRSRSTWQRWTWVAVVGYLTVTMGMGVYVPFIVPAVFVVLFAGIGMLLGRRPLQPGPGAGTGAATAATVRTRAVALLPILGGGAAGVAVLVFWVATRWGTIQKFLDTVYPGQRFEHTGQTTKDGLIALFAAPVTRNLGVTGGQPLGGNASEASTFFLMGLFLAVPAIWLIVRDRRARRGADWLLVALLALTVLFTTFLLVPGWDAIAHLILLDRTTDGRLRMGYGLLSLIFAVVIAQRADAVRAEGSRMPVLATVLAGALAAGCVGVVVIHLLHVQSPLVVQSWSWAVVAVLFVLSVVAFSSGWALVGAVSFLVMSLAGSMSVNPLYRGVYDLNDTAVAKRMHSIQAADPGNWVGVGDSRLPSAVLVQSGLPGYNGFQGAPPAEMWKQIDPGKRHEEQWNRLANLSWVAGQGAPDPRNPAADAILMTFDSCNTFAQRHVRHVVSDAPLDQSCLDEQSRIVQGPTTFYLYSVEKNEAAPTR
ncbi:DUF7657 domain-containing protein [Leifsonia sp. 22587]|uniref:DUF7657 domain-containing protein n=1 Tax=Leifsonia sp. 22587 TaxID=3453946 RepID=UPI003F83C2B3